jgi:Immunity protein Imm1
MSDQQYQEIWSETPDGQAMCALINGDRGWLMYLRRRGDAGFSSRSPSFAGPKNSVIEYVLSNGQRDEYPASWAIPKADIDRALEFFRKECKAPPFVLWHNDSGDGVDLEYKPNA